MPRNSREAVFTWPWVNIPTPEQAQCRVEIVRLAMTLGLRTAARPADILSLGPKHIREGCLQFGQRKTGGVVRIRLEGDLARIDPFQPALTQMTTNTLDRAIPINARMMRGWNVEWRTPNASGRTTTIARTFSEACRHVGHLIPGAQCTAKVIK